MSAEAAVIIGLLGVSAFAYFIEKNLPEDHAIERLTHWLLGKILLLFTLFMVWYYLPAGETSIRIALFTIAVGFGLLSFFGWFADTILGGAPKAIGSVPKVLNQINSHR